jgi:hypothetical protein
MGADISNTIALYHYDYKTSHNYTHYGDSLLQWANRKTRKGMKKANEKLIEYYEEAKGNKFAKYKKACDKFMEVHGLLPQYCDYYSFDSAYRRHTQKLIKN